MVKFNGPFSLNIGTETESGKLYVKGTSSERITFTSAYNFPAPHSWGNIGFYKEATSDSTIEYADISYSGMTHGESIYFLSSSATVSNVNTDGGLWIVNSSSAIKNSSFKNEVHFENSIGKITDSTISVSIPDDRPSISIDSSSPLIENTKISKSSYSGFVVKVKNASSPEIKNSEILGIRQSIAIDLGQNEPPLKAVLLKDNKISGQIMISTSTFSYDYRFRPVILPIAKDLHPIISGNNISSGISLDSVSPKILNNTFVYGGISSRSGYPEIVGNTFYNGGLSINNSGTTDSTGILISKNKLYASGIDLESSSPMISNNFIYGNNGNGIGARVLSLPTIINNTISGNKVDGIYLETGWPTVKNNIIVNNGTGVSGLLPDINRYFSYNLYVNNGINFRIVEKKSTEIISSSSPFLDENDYHLKAGSDVVDRGVSDEAPADDIEERARPIDSDKNGEAKIDIGAYEFSLDSSPGDIAGRIISSTTQGSITGATARISNITMFADSNGNFRFTLVHPGVYTVYYDAPGHIGQTQVIEVKAGQVAIPPTVVMDPVEQSTPVVKSGMINVGDKWLAVKRKAKLAKSKKIKAKKKIKKAKTKKTKKIKKR